MKYLAAYIKSEDLGYFDESNAPRTSWKSVIKSYQKMMLKTGKK